ncbi:MAG: uroporphyrinogen decarboxylase family protein [Kiritimatiellae bacterium]|nr:uroporphyrinogen decarboxylase family protein [Kiritimatiellia bacterium]
MNSRERFIETMTFGRPDRPAAGDYFAYESTRERWEREGLPRGTDLNAYFGMDFYPFHGPQRLPVRDSIWPVYEETVLEETEEFRILRTGAGDIVRVFKNVPPPAMPQFIAPPVRSRADWREFKKRLDPASPERLPEDLAARAEALKTRDYPFGMWVGGGYGYLRNWWGVEGISMLFFDDPALVEEMVETLIHLYGSLFDRVVAAGIPLDWVMFWEDMAYKTGSLISPALYKKYCLPFYRVMIEKIRAANVPVLMLDSDGRIDELIPIWLDLGITIMHPMEVASGMDVIAARKRYGRSIGFYGGIDKRALAGTRSDIRAEVVPKLEAAFGEGGFIPACDHGIPPDISFDNYRYFRDLIREYSER